MFSTLVSLLIAYIPADFNGVDMVVTTSQYTQVPQCRGGSRREECRTSQRRLQVPDSP
jgi:hypothetical protein